MMGERRVMQEALFYGFSLERHVPEDHLLRKIDRFVDLSGLRAHLGPYYSDVGRPSIGPSSCSTRACSSSATASAFARSGDCTRKSTSIWPTDGFVGWGSTATSRTIRRFPRTAMAVFARATSCANCSRPWWRAA